MSDEKFRNQYRIQSARATWHDYSGGAYFITVCTKKREHFFGEIVCNDVTADGENTIILSPIGQFLHENLQNATDHYPYAEIPLFVVMPNHWHAVVFIDGDKTPYHRRDGAQDGARPCRDGARPVSTNETMRQIDSMKGWLSVAVGGIKSAVTKFALANDIDFAWQTRFHDKIIRDQTAMNKIADYIEHNVATWNTDCFNKPL